jgi:hypothetical protein
MTPPYPARLRKFRSTWSHVAGLVKPHAGDAAALDDGRKRLAVWVTATVSPVTGRDETKGVKLYTCAPFEHVVDDGPAN